MIDFKVQQHPDTKQYFHVHCPESLPSSSQTCGNVPESVRGKWRLNLLDFPEIRFIQKDMWKCSGCGETFPTEFMKVLEMFGKKI